MEAQKDQDYRCRRMRPGPGCETVRRCASEALADSRMPEQERYPLSGPPSSAPSFFPTFCFSGVAQQDLKGGERPAEQDAKAWQ